MKIQQQSLPWQENGWMDRAVAWIEAQIAAQGWQITGAVELVHQRPWSVFARVPSSEGAVYFKAPAPPFHYEAALTALLAHWSPRVTVTLLALEPHEGWLLSADAGVTLRSLFRTPEQLTHWSKLLPEYAQEQMRWAERLPDLFDAGVPDRRLERLPQLFTALLEDEASLLVGQETGLSEGEYWRLRDSAGALAQQCAELASFGLPETLVHEELHENNILVQEDRYIYTDWSDASVGHPFFTMIVTLRSIAHWLQLPEHGVELQRVRDAYLEPWTRLAARPQLDRALRLAYRLGMVNRSLSWHRALREVPADVKADYADSVPGWLQDYLAEEDA